MRAWALVLLPLAMGAVTMVMPVNKTFERGDSPFLWGSVAEGKEMVLVFLRDAEGDYKWDSVVPMVPDNWEVKVEKNSRSLIVRMKPVGLGTHRVCLEFVSRYVKSQRVCGYISVRKNTVKVFLLNGVREGVAGHPFVFRFLAVNSGLADDVVEVEYPGGRVIKTVPAESEVEVKVPVLVRRAGEYRVVFRVKSGRVEREFTGVVRASPSLESSYHTALFAFPVVWFFEEPFYGIFALVTPWTS